MLFPEMQRRWCAFGHCGILESMDDLTRRLWEEQNRHPDDRLRLFRAVADFIGDPVALYPGSFVDVAPSFVFDSVTYVDSDRRASRFFADETGVDQIIHGSRSKLGDPRWRFINADFRTELEIEEQSVGLLVSLYAGFVSEYCTRYLRPGGWLLVNSSHGDAAMASIDPRYELLAVVNARSGRYSVADSDLGSYLIPKRPTDVTAELLHETGRGIAYTRAPFAYLFEHKGA